MKTKSPLPPTGKKSVHASAKTFSLSRGNSSFPIIGIGASAGGLEALEQFFRGVPLKSGMAFVIVQHLDPTRKGIMSELLQRATPMKVTQVKNRTVISPDCVYVIPPNKEMSLLHGVLHLLEPVAPRGLRLPIDFFFRSLAQDQKEQSMGVILSGMGSDGTLGLRAIKEKSGVVFVQEPSTAKFESMPQSSIAAGLADIVAPADKLAGEIIAYLKQKPFLIMPEVSLDDKEQSSLEKVIILLRSHTGNDFSFYKRNTLYRRIERRMSVHQISKIPTYIRYLQENSQELDLLFKELLIGVTQFFRDAAIWNQLSTKILPPMLTHRTSGSAFRAWVPGCSTGEEAYSLAIVLKETIQKINPKTHFTIQIFATDLDRDAIYKARQGVFSKSITADVSAERLKRFFTKNEQSYRVNKEIREMVIFAPQNLILDPPFTKLDLLSCRNLLIYFTSDAQKKLIPLFHYSLVPGGILLLGSAETIGNSHDQFSSFHGKSRIFTRSETPFRPDQIAFSSPLHLPKIMEPEFSILPKPEVGLQTQADQLVLQHYAPPSVITNKVGDILYVSGRTGKYLEPAAGKANWNLFAMAQEGLRYELEHSFSKVLQQKEKIVLRGLKIETPNGAEFVTVTLQQLDETGPLKGSVIILFTEASAPMTSARVGPSPQLRLPNTELAKLKLELQQVHSEARIAHEEMQTSQEELRSTNEELQSTNEELQSTNEELTTSKEEMQSMNEELQTVNTELQAKVDELSRTSNDMKNLLDSTDIATLFLDKDLKVRRFTPQATKIIKLIPSDAGRPITDLASELRYSDLAVDAREVLRKLTSLEKQISTDDGRWFTIRIMPYRTLEERIDGVVITFTNITESKTLEAQLRNNPSLLKKSAKKSSKKKSGKNR
ncbi:MAG: chemotaxis protein CheB [Verrucomicrobiota bacterium]